MKPASKPTSAPIYEKNPKRASSAAARNEDDGETLIIDITDEDEIQEIEPEQAPKLQKKMEKKSPMAVLKQLDVEETDLLLQLQQIMDQLNEQQKNIMDRLNELRSRRSVILGN